MSKSQEKVLIYNTSFFDVSQTFIYHQVKSLSAVYDVHLLGKKFLNPHNFDLAGFKNFEIKQSYGLLNRISNKLLNINLFDAGSCIKLINILRKNRYKVIHAHFGTNALDILPFARMFKIPLVVSFHGADASRMLNNKRYADKLPGLFDYASAIIISSRHMAGNLKLEEWEHKVHLIPYGVDPVDFDRLPMNGNLETEKIRILHSGRIVGKKGVPDLIRVFKELSEKFSNIELHIAGDGEEMTESLELVETFNLKGKVLFHGAVPHETVKELLSKTDIFVLNSRIDSNGDMEGTPVTILEAMCMGKAVASTRHAGIPYVIDDGANGVLADERNNEELRNNLEKLIKDQKLRSRLGNEARKTIHKEYTVEIMKQKIRNVFNKL